MIKKLIIMACLMLLSINAIWADFLKFSPQDANLPWEFQLEDQKPSTIREDVRFLETWILKMVEFLRKILWLFVFLWCVYAWWEILISQGQKDALEKGKKQFLWGTIALVLIFVSEPVVRILYWWWQDLIPWELFSKKAETDQWAKFLSQEIIWLADYLKAFAGITTMVMIIMSGVKTAFALTDEKTIDAQKKTIFWCWFWIALMFLSKILVVAWLLPDWTSQVVINQIGDMIQYFLIYIIIIAFLMIIYTGIMYIVTGNDKSKKTLINVAKGLIVIAISYAIASTLLPGTSGSGFRFF